VISTKSTLIFVPIVVPALMSALWKQFLRHNHQIQAEFKKPVHYGQAFFVYVFKMEVLLFERNWE
jgi:hypothetical protein